MTSYSFFADYYDGLTENVNYKIRADYIVRLLKHFNHDFGLTLDLACGTGSFTIELAKKGVDIFGADMSDSMLSYAQQKSYEAGLNILFLRQKMQKLDLYGSIDTCVCTLDSINHLCLADDVDKTFERVSFFMNKGGYFVFDVNTLYKHREILGNNTFVYDTDKVFCVWQNKLFKDKSTVGISLDFFEKTGKTYVRSHESFKEKAYTYDELKILLEKHNFKIKGVFEELTFNEPVDTTQRSVYVAEKL